MPRNKWINAYRDGRITVTDGPDGKVVGDFKFAGEADIQLRLKA